jgi:SOS-response transcriptional repressor LexA
MRLRTFSREDIRVSLEESHVFRHGRYQFSYPEGAYIFVDPDLEATSGSRVIAKMPGNNEFIFKEYREEDGKRYLKPLNPQYPICEMDDQTEICGVVVGQFKAE